MNDIGTARMIAWAQLVQFFHIGWRKAVVRDALHYSVPFGHCLPSCADLSPVKHLRA
jgi:hypothetical protein